MSGQTEQLAWKMVSGLLVLLQLITLAFCGYIILQLDNNRFAIAALEQRVAVVETVQREVVQTLDGSLAPARPAIKP